MSITSYDSFKFIKAINDPDHQARVAISSRCSFNCFIELLHGYNDSLEEMAQFQRGINQGLETETQRRDIISFDSLPREVWKLVDAALLAKIVAKIFRSPQQTSCARLEAERFIDFAEEHSSFNGMFKKQLALQGISYIMSDAVEKGAPDGKQWSMVLVRNDKNENFIFISGCKDDSFKWMMDYYRNMPGELGEYRRLRAVPTLFKLLIEQGEVAHREGHHGSLKAVQRELWARLRQIERVGMDQALRPSMRERISRLLDTAPS